MMNGTSDINLLSNKIESNNLAQSQVRVVVCEERSHFFAAIENA